MVGEDPNKINPLWNRALILTSVVGEDPNDAKITMEMIKK